MAAAVVFAVADLIAEDEEVENCSIEARKSSTVVKATGGFGSRLGRAALAIKNCFVVDNLEVLLHYGGFCNNCTPKRCLHISVHFQAHAP